MKRFAAIVFALLILAVSAVCTASEKAPEEEVPENVMNWFESSALPYLKEFMGKQGNSYVPQYFTSKEEVDLLTVGSVYRLYTFNGSRGSISEMVDPSDMWLFTLDLDEPKVYVAVLDGDPLDTFGPVTAENLAAAFDVLKRTADNAGVEFKPVLIDYGWHYLAAYMSFNGDERIVPIPPTAFKLDESYDSVTSYLELPDALDLIGELDKKASESVTNANGEVVYGSDPTLRLAPRLGAGANEAASVKENSPLMRALPFAAYGLSALLIIAAVVFSVSKKN